MCDVFINASNARALTNISNNEKRNVLWNKWEKEIIEAIKKRATLGFSTASYTLMSQKVFLPEEIEMMKKNMWTFSNNLVNCGYTIDYYGYDEDGVDFLIEISW